MNTNPAPHSLSRHIVHVLAAVSFCLTCLGQTPITCGTPVHGTFTVLGQLDSYVFSGSAGESVLMTPIKSSDLCVAADLYDPAGNRIGGTTCGVGTSVELPTSGDYTVTVYGWPRGVGDYALMIQFTTGRCAVPIGCGQLVTNEIRAPYETDAYSFAANAGDAVVFAAKRLTGDLCGAAMLCDPTGRRLVGTADFGAGCGANSTNITLTTTGTYTIIVYDRAPAGGLGQNTGGYVTYWFKINSACNGLLLACGEKFDAAISGRGDVDYFSLVADAGDLIEAHLTGLPASMGPILELYDAAGQELASVSGDAPVLTGRVPAGGTYGLRVRTSDFMTFPEAYSLVWQKLNDPCNARTLSCGQSFVVTNLSPSGSDFYRFTASAGDFVGVGVDAGDRVGDLSLSVYDPAGDLVASAANLLTVPPRLLHIRTNLAVAGTYSLGIRDTWGSYNGPYGVVWQRLLAPCNAMPLACGASASVGYREQFGAETYVLPANAGTHIQATLTPAGAPAAWTFELYGPAGMPITPLVNDCWDTCVLRSGGPVALTGNYTLFVQNLSSSPGYTLTRNCDVIVVEPRIKSITPNYGTNTRPVMVAIEFEFLDLRQLSDPILARLTLAGQSREGVIVDSGWDGTTVSVQFDLRGAKPGVWDLEVVLPDGRILRMNRAFTVLEGDEKLWTQVMGSPRPRLGRPVEYGVICGNSGETPVTNILVTLQRSDSGGRLLEVTIPSIAPADMVTHSVSLTPSESACFDLLAEARAMMSEPLAASNVLRVCPATSIDPNEKVGPAGYDAPDVPLGEPKHYFAADHPHGYMVLFENLSAATAAVQNMSITDMLSPEWDLSTFRFGAIQIGARRLEAPENSQSWSTNVDLRPEVEAIVTIECQLSGDLASWYFAGSNPDAPTELADFLPPNTDTIDPAGRGWVSYSVRPKSGLATGTVITNVATIDFEVGIPPAPMSTPSVFNTIDSGQPTSQVNPLPPTVSEVQFVVSWSGQDDAGGSGIASFDVYVRRDGGPLSLWKAGTTVTSALFAGEPGHSYAFYSTATDQVGNAETTPASPDTVTTIASTASPLLRIGRSGPDVVISWPSTSSGFHLEFADHLGPGGLWQPVGTPPVDDGAHLEVTVQPTAASRFYRLSK